MSDVALRNPPAPRPSGWWGMALFVGTEATLFGTLVGTYVYLRAQASAWPPAGVPEPDALWPLVLTAALVATTVPLRASLGAARAGHLSRARFGLVVALAVQAGYLAAQLVLFAHDLDRFPPDGSAYASIYFTLLGAHAAHVAAGMLLELWVLVRLVSGLTRYRLVALQVTVFYWVFVNVLAVIVVAVQLSPRL
jgi:heme/copper-type cytochrome/quinol oxidase subunit 3